MQTFFKCLFASLLYFSMLPVYGQEAALPFEEGVHYQELSRKIYQDSSVEALMAKDKGRIQIVEFFSYACHWCNQVDTKAADWYATQRGADLAFRRVPVIFRPTWRPLAKAYFVAEALKVTAKVHRPLFEQIQVLHVDLSTDDAIRAFFIKTAEISAQDFDAHYHSFSLNRDLENINQLLRVYQIMAVPAFIINGSEHIYSTSVARVGSEEKLFELFDFLISKERAAHLRHSDLSKKR